MWHIWKKKTNLNLVFIFYIYYFAKCINMKMNMMKKGLYEQTNEVPHVIVKMLLYEVYQYSQAEKGTGRYFF